MYPELFRVGSFEVTSFGALVALAALVGLWMFSRELRRGDLPSAAADVALVAVVVGLLGAKSLYVLEHLGTEPLRDLLTERGGLSFFGGLVAGMAVAVAAFWRRRWPVVALMAAATPALAIGHAIGRVGCLLVGDDYGRPTDLPWGMAFPRGLPPVDVPVHPTQLYEAIPLALFAVWLIRWRRAGMADLGVLGRYFVFAGLLRFAIEFIRTNTRVVGPFTVAHLAAAALAVLGAVLLVRNARRGS